MGSILSAIHDDIEEYTDLCRKYGEDVVTSYDKWGNLLPDCYSDHAQALKQRARDDWKAVVQMNNEMNKGTAQ